MKRVSALFIAVSLVMTCFVITPITANAADTPVVVPSTWELLAEESFIKGPVDNGDGTTTSTFPLTTYASDFYTAVDVYDSTDTTKKELAQQQAYINDIGLNLSMPSSISKRNDATFSLANSIDLTEDADYYFIYDVNPHGRSVGATAFRLLNSTNNALQVASNLSSNNSNLGLAISEYKPSINGHAYYVNDRDFDYSAYSNKWQRVVMQISPRADGNMLVRERWFNLEVEGAEAPTISPKYWHTALWYDTATDFPEGSLDKLYIANSHNSGSSLTTRYRNFKLYKSAGLNGYTTPTLRADGTTAIAAKNRTTDAVASTSNYTYTISMQSTLPENTTLVSQGWYDYTDEANPVLLTNNASFDVPSNFARKKLVAKRVVNENGTEVTYYPFSGTVHAPIELTTTNQKSLRDSSAFNLTATYYKTVNGVKASTTSNVTTANGVSALTYEDWQNATQFKIIANLMGNVYAHAEDGLIAMTVAQYDKDGFLKKIYVPNPDDATALTRPYQYTNFNAKSTGYFQLTLTPGTNLTFAPGDYFKAFVWSTTSTPAKVNNKYYYNYEQMIPVVYSPEVEYSIYDINAPVLTVPYPAE
ncbi:MAG: hypothetical protein PHE51_05410 [Eubacteriales bacterium]|nr:hypothetical protein [Eubacteriales bacterium]